MYRPGRIKVHPLTIFDLSFRFLQLITVVLPDQHNDVLAGFAVYLGSHMKPGFSVHGFFPGSRV